MTNIFPIHGLLINASTGYPLNNLRVAAYFIESAEEDASTCEETIQKEYLLGTGNSDVDGHFEIIFRDSPLVHQWLCLLKQCQESSFILKVENLTGELYLTSDPLSGTTHFPIVLAVPLPAQPVSTSIWKELGRRMEQNRLVRLNDLVQQLTVPETKQLIFRDWDWQTRQNVLNELEQSFLDPKGILRQYAMLPGFYSLSDTDTLAAYQQQIQPYLDNPEVQTAFSELVGKLQSFSSFSNVDWVTEPTEFLRGNPGAAIAKFQDLYTADARRTGSDVIGRVPMTDQGRYRDYLRSIWVNSIAPPEDNLPHDPSVAIALLSQRFHQDFETYNDALQPANPILIDIVKEILTANQGSDYGFGIPASTIEDQKQRTPRQYLDYLIKLTKLSATELGLRYRLDLQRPDSALSSRVQENIFTLQHFFADSFQCDPEPLPIIHAAFLGKAPFFLEYEEWLRQTAPFYGENFYQLKRLGKNYISADHFEGLNNAIKTNPAQWKWVGDLVGLRDELQKGFDAFNASEFVIARDHYVNAVRIADSIIFTFSDDDWNQVRLFFRERRKRKIATVGDLDWLTGSFAGRYLEIPDRPEMGGLNHPNDPWGQWLENLNSNKPDVIYVQYYVLPLCFAEVEVELGNYVNAVDMYRWFTHLVIDHAALSDPGGYAWIDRGVFGVIREVDPYSDDDLPYTAERLDNRMGIQELKRRFGSYLDNRSNLLDTAGGTAGLDWRQRYSHAIETIFFRLRHGHALLEWADTLYRTDDASNIARARELYKAVLWLHGETPPIAPNWSSGSGSSPSAVYGNRYTSESENPAITSQKTRARLGFYQIEAGLNYYGYRSDFVPILRYRPLKDAADRFAAAAKSAQQDLLNYFEQIEAAIIENLKAANMLKKASLQAQIAVEQAKIAQDEVKLAQQQVENVNQAIQDKQNEIDDHDSLFNQFKDYISGMVKIGKDIDKVLPKETEQAIAAYGKQAIGLEEVEGEGFLGLGVTGFLTAGFAAFAIMSYMTLTSMADARNQRMADLATLRDRTLPAANALLDAKQRSVTIAILQQQIAQADADLAKNLIAFQSDRFLNIEFWSTLAVILKRVLRRYLELSAKTAWFAERALAYEQDCIVRIIRFDYFPVRLQGISGADLLQLDLAELEATRLDGIKETIPVKHTVSLARDFPLQFGQLKQSGHCTFKTEELPLRYAYPGAYNYRIRSVTVTINKVGTINPIRGLLRNQGFSLVSQLNNEGDSEAHVSLRPADALPISEFRLNQDMAVYGLPDEALLPFEGSGIESFWNLELPMVANPYGLENIVDILLTFDLRAHYSYDLYQKHILSLPSSVQHLVLVSARRHDPSSLVALRGSASVVTIKFDMTSIGLPKEEKNRKVKNLLVLIPNEKLLTFNAVFDSSTIQPPQATLAIDRNVALSNAPPLSDSQSSLPLSPLNAFVDQDVDQTFQITIDKSNNPNVDFSTVSDVILGVEYSTDLIRR